MTVHSFDIFDTCLTRTFARPTDLFFNLARRVAARCGLKPDADAAHEFMARRVAAERAARRACTAEDLSLPAIYEHLDAGPPFTIDADESLAMELELEAESLRPVPMVSELLDRLRAQGERICFISDMYLPGDFVRDQLLRHGLARPEDPVYVSGDHGCCKWSGNLYRLVLDELGIAPNELHHMGDNALADVRIPRKLGIRARRFVNADLSRHESSAIDRGRDHDLAGSRLAAASRLSRLGGLSLNGRSVGNRDTWVELAASVVAPVLGVFTAWVLRQAREQKVARLYFVSRDGQILWRMARAMAEGDAERSGDVDDGAKGVGPLPELRYLFGSRQAWFLPALKDAELASPDWLFVPGHSRRPVDLLRKLGLSPSDFTGQGLRPEDPFWTGLPAPGRERELLDLLQQEQPRRILRNSRDQARLATLGYLAQEGLADPLPMALVDVGWTLKAQAALRGLLARLGHARNLSGFYFGLTRSRLSQTLAGPARGWLTERVLGSQPRDLSHFFFRNANLIEQVFTMADHGLVMGYAEREGRFEAVLRPLNPDPAREEFVAVLHARAVAVARELGRAGALEGDYRPWHDAALRVLRTFLERPDAAMVRSLGFVRVGDDQTESRTRPLAAPVGPGHLYRAWRVLRRGPEPEDFGAGFDWIEGATAISPFWMRPFLRRRSVFELLRAWRKSC